MRDGSTSQLVEQPKEHPRQKVCVSVVIPVRNGGSNFARCLDAIRSCDPAPYELIVVDDGSTDDSVRQAQERGARILATPHPASGPAAARNIGGQAARGDVLMFVDADVALHPDAIGRVMRHFEVDTELAACFGSYDDAPAAPNVLSQYKNLFHHYVHQSASENASTFWAGCGAIRRDVFLQVDGFSRTYRRPAIEDIELGYRLKATGLVVRLDKQLQGKHLKTWTLASLLRADILDRGIPWTELILRDGAFINDLNLQTHNRVSVIATYWMIGCMLVGLWQTLAWAMAGLSAAGLLVLNHRLYRFFAARRGAFFAVRVIPLHWLYYAYNGVSFAMGLVSHLKKSRQADGRPAETPFPSVSLGANTAGPIALALQVTADRRAEDGRAGACMTGLEMTRASPYPTSRYRPGG